MPINYQQAVEQIRKMGEGAPERAEAKRERIELARQILAEYAGQGAALSELAGRAANLNPRLRCGLPAGDPLDASIPAQPALETSVVMAADGSQIYPDRHLAVEYAAINVGAVCMRPTQGSRETIASLLLFDDDLYEDGLPLTEGIIALRRDLSERQMLFRLAEVELAQGLHVVTLTDGPLELYQGQEETDVYKRYLDQYIAVLKDIAELKIVTAGYVDKPGSSSLVNLLELVLLERDGRLADAGKLHPLFPVRDEDLLHDLLQPGGRSAALELRSVSAQKFTGPLALHFFYLNVGREDLPHLARVELPEWVSGDAELMNLLHAALLAQAAQMGARPYPYILHRAHEVAVVSFEERDQLETMIQAELRRQGVGVGEKSNKQSAKDLEGRTRMKR